MFKDKTVFILFISLLLILVSCKKSSSPTGNEQESNPVPTSIEITPDSLVLDHHGGTGQFAAVVKDQDGRPMDNVGITWTSGNEESAQVNGEGNVTGMIPGTAVITASAGPTSAEAKTRTMLQMNPACKEPASFPDKPPAAGPVSFANGENSFDHVIHDYNQQDQVAYDFDGDGDQDILVFASNFPETPDTPKGGKVFALRNDAGYFNLATETVLEPDSIRADHTRQFEIADFNGDGIPDLFAAQHGWDASPFPGAPDLLLLSRTNGQVEEVGATHLNPYITDGFSHASANGDVDCDGDVDIVMSTIGERQATYLFINNGSGNFTEANSQLPDDIRNGSAMSVTAADMCDIDRDGDVDLFLGVSGGTTSGLLVNNGFGEFRPAMYTPLPEGPYSNTTIVDVRCRDLDLDGWNDIVVSATENYERGQITLFQNNKNGGFENITGSWLSNGWENGWIFRAFVADFNADGWLDIFPSGNPDYQRIYYNNGGTGFTSSLPPADHLELYVIDANADGRSDLYWPGHPGEGGAGILFRNIK